MKGFVKDIEGLAVQNVDFLHVLHTAVLVPAETNHNIVNTGTVPLKLSTLSAPPNHRDGVVHHSHAEAKADHERFDGTTTE